MYGVICENAAFLETLSITEQVLVGSHFSKVHLGTHTPRFFSVQLAMAAAGFFDELHSQMALSSEAHV